MRLILALVLFAVPAFAQDVTPLSVGHWRGTLRARWNDCGSSQVRQYTVDRFVKQRDARCTSLAGRYLCRLTWRAASRKIVGTGEDDTGAVMLHHHYFSHQHGYWYRFDYSLVWEISPERKRQRAHYVLEVSVEGFDVCEAHWKGWIKRRRK